MNDGENIKDFLASGQSWRDFRRELIYQNRFFPKVDEVLDKIKSIIPMLTCSLQEGSEWYRAREIEECNTDVFLDDDSAPEEEWGKISYNQKIPNLIEIARLTHHSNIEANDYELMSKIAGEREKFSEWGYSKNESGMPPRDRVGLNRANPRYITYLYLANDVNTSLAETKALVGQPFSIAKYKIIKPCNVVDFCQAPKFFGVDNSTPEDWLFCTNIHNAFSKPSHSNEKDYIVSQYIAEYVKTLGFEGIVFRSSQNKDGINLTLFDDSGCEFLGSEIHEVTDIKVKSRRILPLPLNEKQSLSEKIAEV